MKDGNYIRLLKTVISIQNIFFFVFLYFIFVSPFDKSIHYDNIYSENLIFRYVFNGALLFGIFSHVSNKYLKEMTGRYHYFPNLKVELIIFIVIVIIMQII